MSAAVARALTMMAVVFQSYFNWDPGTSIAAYNKDYLTSVGPSVTGRDGGSCHLTGLILARGGSKGIPRKNMVEINGRPLVGRSLDAMIESGVFTSIWVSTDDPEISRWVTSHYVKEGTLVNVHKRAAYTATDSASSLSAVLEFLSFYPEVDAVGLVQATSPFVQAEYLQQAASKLLQPGDNSHSVHESVFSVTRSRQLRWSSVEGASSSTTEKGSSDQATKPLNFNTKARPRRQEWDGEMVENGMFYFAFRHVLVNYQVFQSDRSSYIEIPKHLSLEIDTYDDLEVARCLASRIDGKIGSLRSSQHQGQQDTQNHNAHHYHHRQDNHPDKGQMSFREKQKTYQAQMKEL